MILKVPLDPRCHAYGWTLPDADFAFFDLRTASEVSMVIRVFRALVQPGQQADFEAMARRLSVPLVRKQKGLLGFYAGRPLGHAKDEFVMVTLWDSVESIRAFVSPDWEQAVVPEEERPVLLDSFVHHYEAYADSEDREGGRV